jgi:murein DD-endopeptidase MepM/ murein hydrolase activator NlpD
MNKVNYVYNQKTCQYERARLSFKEALVYVLGLLAMSIAFFVGLVFLYNYLLETDTERALRAENKAITKYKPVLEQKLLMIQTSLASLDEKDKVLYAQLFNAPQPVQPTLNHTLAKDKVLLANASRFKGLMEALETKSNYLYNHATYSNKLFGSSIHITDDDKRLLGAVPSLPPIKDIQVENLASGFGDRINPFHKGIYHHSGIDLAFPRGTEVMATADGTVILVKHSDLQAGYGNFIEIDHGFGFISRYAHLEEIKVRTGQKISKGTLLGLLGSSGGSVAPHLHYEIIRDGEQVNPVLYMIEGATSETFSALLKESKKQNQSLD